MRKRYRTIFIGLRGNGDVSIAGHSSALRLQSRHSFTGRSPYLVFEINHPLRAIAVDRRRTNIPRKELLMRKLLKQDSRELGLNVCAHGDVHLQYNGMTLHFDAQQFDWFAKAVAQLLNGINNVSRRDYLILPRRSRTRPIINLGLDLPSRRCRAARRQKVPVCSLP